MRRLTRSRGVALTPTDLLASSLAKLAVGIQLLEEGFAATAAAEGGSDAAVGPHTMLFAGRRSSSRRYLLLQNWWAERVSLAVCLSCLHLASTALLAPWCLLSASLQLLHP